MAKNRDKRTDDDDEDDGKSKKNSDKRCPVGRKQFEASATPLTVKIYKGDEVVAIIPLNVKMFSTGSYGWHGQGGVVIPVKGDALTTDMPCQTNFMLIGKYSGNNK